jgi:hypothetical protein
MFGGSHTYFRIACHQSAKRVMSRPALTGRKLYAEDADPASVAAGRQRQDAGASANFCFESGGYDYRGGCEAVATAVVDGNAA